ncbi:hypothetical protein MPER_03733 [Moniliophthora perniciosa FA553]|nr:hypothetical protein MPER_03733 [Moniliophthora perniciosa FA553]
MTRRQEVIDERTNHVPQSARAEFIDRRVNKGKPIVESGQVHIVDNSYLEHSFEAGDQRRYIDDTLARFNLNVEQERAFRIIANHAASSHPEQLKMYIGGMGGTGKSTVLKALIHYFSVRKEDHRLLVVAPTGSAAALLGGSTYHSAFGINDRTSASYSLPNVRERLMGVQYVFFDEVSMLSGLELYRISRQLCLPLFVMTVNSGG